MPLFGTVRWITVPCLLVAACALLAPQRSLAATKEPPYEAIVESDEAFFRCGPGKNFYPTGALQRGDRVTVRRHDPGGWFMIDPPAGSYSLISADAVQREGNVGTVKPLAEGQTPIRIGSALDPTVDSVYQRQLSSGERVEILGEATRTHRGVPVLMFKVHSPKGEYRWIEGMNLIPVDQHMEQQQIRDQQASSPPMRKQAVPQQPVQQPPVQPQAAQQPAVSQQTESDPFAAPAATQKKAPAVGQTTVSRKPAAKLISLSPATNIARQTPVQQGPIAPSAPASLTTIPAVEPHSRLEQIDLQFRDTLQRHPTTWNLGQLEQSYRELSQQSVSVAMRGQIDLRFSAIAHYKQVKSEYVDYFRLVSATARKDAELAAIQNSLDPRDARPPIMPPEQAATAGDSPMVVAPNSGGPAIPVPAVNTQNSPAAREINSTPSVPEFNSQPQKAATPPTETHVAGPVLENPVPLPTEPQPEPTPPVQQQPTSQPPLQQQPIAQPMMQPMMQPQPNIVSRPAVPVPPETYPNRELPTQQSMTRQASPMMQQPQRQFIERPMQSPTMTVAPPSPPSPQPAPAPLPNTDIAQGSQQGPQPTVAAPMPSQGPMSQSPSAPMTPPMAPPQQIRPQAPGGLDGAGIVQQAATPIPGGPRHVLLAPNGRILAYLYPDRGVNLDAYVGRSMGVFGPRSYRAELRNDLIVVRGVVPVRLVP
jgi:hypothetical protein